jgi:hypothetical protein
MVSHPRAVSKFCKNLLRVCDGIGHQGAKTLRKAVDRDILKVVTKDLRKRGSRASR